MQLHSLLMCTVTGVLLVVARTGTTPCQAAPDSVPGYEKCRPCDFSPFSQAGNTEVHALGTTAPNGGTFKVDVGLKEGTSPRSVKLILISSGGGHWTVTPSPLVYIEAVVSVTKTSASRTTQVVIMHGPEFLKKHTKEAPLVFGPNGAILTTEVENFVQQDSNLGALTSYVANASAVASFPIMLGECDKPHQAKCELNDNVNNCLLNSRCLVQMPFDYDATLTKCNGTQYVTKYGRMYVGIVMCEHTSKRFKLLLNSRLGERFLNVADRVPYGTMYSGDHCQLIGQAERDANTSHITTCPDNTFGFYRSHSDDPFVYGRICGRPDTAAYTGTQSPLWYSCGEITIPNAFSIVTAQPCQNGKSYETRSDTQRMSMGSVVGGAVAGVMAVVALLVAVVVLVVIRRRRATTRRPMDIARRPAASLPPEPLYIDVKDPFDNIRVHRTGIMPPAYAANMDTEESIYDNAHSLSQKSPWSVPPRST